MAIDQKTLDLIATLEVAAYLDGLNDPEVRLNPSFLEKVRKFLVQNNLKTTPETPGVLALKKQTADIPTFEDLQ